MSIQIFENCEFWVLSISKFSLFGTMFHQFQKWRPISGTVFTLKFRFSYKIFFFFIFKKPNFLAFWGPALALNTKYQNFLILGLFSCKNLTDHWVCSWKSHNPGDHNLHHYFDLGVCLSMRRSLVQGYI